MGIRWIIALSLYTMLIGPIMDVPSSNVAKAKPRPQTNRASAHR